MFLLYNWNFLYFIAFCLKALLIFSSQFIETMLIICMNNKNIMQSFIRFGYPTGGDAALATATNFSSILVTALSSMNTKSGMSSGSLDILIILLFKNKQENKK